MPVFISPTLIGTEPERRTGLPQVERRVPSRGAIAATLCTSFCLLNVVACSSMRSESPIESTPAPLPSPVTATKPVSPPRPPAALSQQEAQTSFNDFFADYLTRFNTSTTIRITKLGGGWVRERVGSPSDVRKGTVLVLPGPSSTYHADAEFTLVKTYTDFHDAQDGARHDNSFVGTKETRHWHKYEMHEGQWSATSRRHRSERTGRWADCNEVIRAGPNAGQRDLWGCWEQ